MIYEGPRSHVNRLNLSEVLTKMNFDFDHRVSMGTLGNVDKEGIP